MSETTEVIIRDMEKGEEFAEWFADLLLRHDDETGLDVHRDDRYLVLSNEIGDWIGGLRYCLQGGVAQLLELRFPRRSGIRDMLTGCSRPSNSAPSSQAHTWASSGPMTSAQRPSCSPLAGAGCSPGRTTSVSACGTSWKSGLVRWPRRSSLRSHFIREPEASSSGFFVAPSKQLAGKVRTDGPKWGLRPPGGYNRLSYHDGCPLQG